MVPRDARSSCDPHEDECGVEFPSVLTIYLKVILRVSQDVCLMRPRYVTWIYIDDVLVLSLVGMYNNSNYCISLHFTGPLALQAFQVHANSQRTCEMICRKKNPRKLFRHIQAMLSGTVPLDLSPIKGTCPKDILSPQAFSLVLNLFPKQFH